MIIIGDHSFTSQVKGKDFVRNILNKLGECEIYKDDLYFDFFTNLLDHHHNPSSKIGVGIKAFRIRHNMVNKATYEMSIVRIDNSVETFSWVQCVSEIPKTNERLIKEELVSAMRMSIVEQIELFRKEHINDNCNLCS